MYFLQERGDCARPPLNIVQTVNDTLRLSERLRLSDRCGGICVRRKLRQRPSPDLGLMIHQGADKCGLRKPDRTRFAHAFETEETSKFHFFVIFHFCAADCTYSQSSGSSQSRRMEPSSERPLSILPRLRQPDAIIALTRTGLPPHLSLHPLTFGLLKARFDHSWQRQHHRRLTS